MNTPPNPGVWLFLADLALLLAALTAVALARVRPRHWPVAIYLGGLFLADLVRRGLASTVLSQPGPYVGAERAAFHAEQALYLAAPAALAAVAITVLHQVEAPAASRRVHLGLVAVAGFWLCNVAVVVLGYPEIRADHLGRVYLGAEIASLIVVSGSAITWARRRDPLELTALAVYILAAVEVAKVAAGPFAGDVFGRWPLAWPMHLVCYGALSVVHGGGLWLSRQR